MDIRLSFLIISLASLSFSHGSDVTFVEASSSSSTSNSFAAFAVSVPDSDANGESDSTAVDESTGANHTNGTHNSTSGHEPIRHNSTSVSGTKKDTGVKVSSYYPSYNADLGPLSEVNYELYDELIFFTATTNSNFTIGLGGIEPTQWDTLAHEFVHRCKKASVIPTVAIGGWTGSLYFSDLVATVENRTTFANSLVDFAKKYDFAGVDIDWEWPSLQGIGCNAVRDNDIENLGLFTEELKKIWPQMRLTLASSVAGVRDSTSAAVSAERVASLVKNVDSVHMMAYDVFGGWSSTTGPLAPLSDQCAESADKLSVKRAYETYIKQGFSKEQLVVGIPTYARSFGLASPTLVPKTVGNYTTYYYQNFTSVQPGGAADDKPGVDVCGQATSWGGTWMVKELIDNGFLSKSEKEGLNGFTLYQDECSGVPFLASNSTLISFDGTQSSVNKAKWARESGLGGIYFFDTISGLDRTVKHSRKEFLKN